jgi:hypothetical protein
VALVEREDVTGPMPIGQDEDRGVAKSKLEGWVSIQDRGGGANVLPCERLQPVGARRDFT